MDKGRNGGRREEEGRTGEKVRGERGRQAIESTWLRGSASLYQDSVEEAL